MRGDGWGGGGGMWPTKPVFLLYNRCRANVSELRQVLWSDSSHHRLQCVKFEGGKGRLIFGCLVLIVWRLYQKNVILGNRPIFWGTEFEMSSILYEISIIFLEISIFSMFDQGPRAFGSEFSLQFQTFWLKFQSFCLNCQSFSRLNQGQRGL